MEVSVVDILSSLVKKWWVIVLSALVCGAVAFSYCNFFVAPQYSATGSCVIATGTSIIGTEDDPSMKTSDVSVTLALSNSLVDVLSSRGIYEVIAEKYDFGYTPLQLKYMTRVVGREDSLIADITVVSGSVEDSVKIVNAILNEAQGYMKSKMASVNIATLDKAISAVQTAPKTVFMTLLAFVAGAIISAVIIYLVSYFDNTIKGEDDIIKTFNVPVLGTIPDFSNATGSYEYKAKANK